MPTTDDPNDPRLTHGVDNEPTTQAAAYLVLSEQERAKGFVRPVRRTYVHVASHTPHSGVCGAVTTMSSRIAETFARDPRFYGSTWCSFCQMHRPVREFVWDGTAQEVGS